MDLDLLPFVLAPAIAAVSVVFLLRAWVTNKELMTLVWAHKRPSRALLYSAISMTLVGVALVTMMWQMAIRANQAEATDPPDLEVCNLALRHQSDAFQDMMGAHHELQQLHERSRQWGPTIEPYDCVRETILLNADAWPDNPEADRAYLQNENEWLRLQRHKCLDDLDQVEMWQEAECEVLRRTK